MKHECYLCGGFGERRIIKNDTPDNYETEMIECVMCKGTGQVEEDNDEDKN